MLKNLLGLLSKGNRDLHTTRSIEIPFLGGLLCAERTVEHVLLYDDKQEAVFWNDAEECALCCNELLDEEPLRIHIAKKGQARAIKNNHLNEPTVEHIIRESLKL